MNKHTTSIGTRAFLLAALTALAGCATTTEKAPAAIQYSDERNVMYQIEQTRKILEEHPVEALARARALKDNAASNPQVETLFSEAGSRAKTEFAAAIEAKRW
ncbi:MAG TPA: hypothetical protein PKO22_04030, partial [Treponemataceae bacterium]|nr:hypothetical protein [Treponemataceae bacterium]